MNTSATDRGAVLLSIARNAIAAELGRGGKVRDDGRDLPWLREPGACFVTLTQRGELRGCIGTLEAQRALLDEVKANARAAAFSDPRFAPLGAAELESTAIEISLLSVPEPMRFASEADALAQLRPGIDGVIFQYGNFRSTFLPQVWEQLPDAAAFMAHLKRKCALPADFWASEVQLQRYTVTKFSEKDPLSESASPGAMQR